MQSMGVLTVRRAVQKLWPAGDGVKPVNRHSVPFCVSSTRRSAKHDDPGGAFALNLP